MRNKLLLQLSVDWMEGWKNRDADFLSTIVHDEFILVGRSVKKFGVNKTEWMEMALIKYELVSYKYEFLDAKVIGNTGIVQSIVMVKAKPAIYDQYLSYSCSDVWVNTDTGWKVIHRHLTALN